MIRTIASRPFALALAALALITGQIAAQPAWSAARKPLVISGSQTAQLPAGDTLQTNASTTAGASINLPHGTAPTSPVNGDVWTTTGGVYARVNGATVGPFSAGGGSALPQHDTTNALALAAELAANGFATAKNTFLGEQAGSTVSSGVSSTAQGGRNVAIGYRAGRDNTTGWQNTGVGFIALMKTTTGQYNTALGAYTLVENTTGSNNTGLGADALWLNTTGNDNTGTGSYVLQQNTTASDNSAFGKEALRYGTTGGGNSAFGSRAMRQNITGIDNAAFGLEAMMNGTAAGNNAAFGARALRTCAACTENSALGGYALYALTSGTRNTAAGFGAFDQLTTGSNNVGVGYFSGEATTTGSDNTFIGKLAGLSNTTGSRNILIGYNVNASSATATDEINIGGTIAAVRTGRFGYAAGLGGTVTQATSRSTGVTLNKVTGAITLVSAAGSTSWTSLTVTNSEVTATDVIQVSQKSGTDKYMIFVTNVAAGSFEITFATTGGTTTEQPVFTFMVLMAQAS